jgi:ER-bound oxygenase mpaB/B'/Rubber oxygenase, catalytic domain
MERGYWTRRIGELDPATDFHEIYRILGVYEFPWDMNQSLGFALYRTYAVPSIGRLLHRTGELTQRTQRRYDDTVIVLDTILEHGLSSEAGRTALRRMNQMHGAYDISNDDKLYVLSTFVVVPTRWLDRYGWRPLTGAERAASANYYRELGKHMGIKDIPGTHQEFADFLDRYEEEHFGFDPGGLAVSEATLRLMATFPPNHLAPRVLVDRFAKALMDDRLLAAFGYRQPPSWERAIASGALRLRAAIVRFLPPRKEPLYPRQRRSIRSYPRGYDVAKLGTFPEEPAGELPAPGSAHPLWKSACPEPAA